MAVIDLDAKAEQAIWGGLVDVAQPRVSDLVRREILRKDGTYLEWLHDYAANLRTVAAGRGGGDAQRVLSEAKAREATASAELKEMEIARQAGKLVPADEVVPMWRSMVTAARSELLAMSRRLHGTIKDDYGVDVPRETIDRYVYAALDHLAGYDPGRSSAEDEEPVLGDLESAA